MKLVKNNKFIKKIINIVFFFNKTTRVKLRNNIDQQVIKTITEEIKNKYPNDYIIFSRNGVGDIFFVASLLKEFKKNNSGKIVYITDKPKLCKFIKAFSSVDEVIGDSKFGILQFISPLQKSIQKGNINYIFFPYRGSRKNYTFADSYSNLLGLEYNPPRELPKLTKKNKLNAEKEIKRLGISPDKTILLIPEAVMFDHRILDSKFWKDLADKLTNMGYDVVFNSNNKAYKKYKNTFIEMTDFIEFCKNIKHIISFRSGICDVLVGVGITNITSIYPQNLEVIWADKFIFDNLLNKYHEKTKETEFENIFHIYSLNSNFHRNDIKEIIHNTNKQTMQEILNSITEERLTTTKIKTTIK